MSERVHRGKVVLAVLGTISALTITGTLVVARTVLQPRVRPSTYHFLDDPDAARRALEEALGDNPVMVHQARFERAEVDVHVVHAGALHRYRVHPNGQALDRGGATPVEGATIPLTAALLQQMSQSLALAQERYGAQPTSSTIHRDGEGTIVFTIRVQGRPRPITVTIHGEFVE